MALGLRLAQNGEVLVLRFEAVGDLVGDYDCYVVGAC